MESIFNQIKRFEGVDIEFTPGSEFTFILPSTNSAARTTTVTHTEPQKTNDDLVTGSNEMEVGGNYTIHVKKYMTEGATPTFDFQTKWNDNKPMPLMIMDGKVIQETRGMFKMELHGTARPTSVCCCCGRKLTNKISMLYGIGPECGNHFYINPYGSKEELEEHWHELKQKMCSITWTGWVIKSAIKEWSEINND